MSSCGNPEAESDALMQGKSKFDKSTSCIKCKTQRGNIVIRHAVYCKECFFPLVTTKFRRSLDPHINEAPESSRRAALKASGNLLVGFSGGLGSTVLLDVIGRNYFPQKQPAAVENGRGGGGRSHPRNKRIWEKAYACYVELSGAFPEESMKDRTNDVREYLEGREDFERVLCRLEDAFDPEWWRRIGKTRPPDNLEINLQNEDLPLNIAKEDTSLRSDPRALLRTYLSSLPTPTAIQSAISTLIRLILVYTAQSLNCSHVLLGTSLTSYSISLISSIAQGGGFNVPEEGFEEWKEATKSNITAGSSSPKSIRIARPLRDIGMKECAAWAWWSGLDVIGKEKHPGINPKQTITGLTRNFIVGLESGYPSTVSTIVRTCAKVKPKDEAKDICSLCERPTSANALDWKARISIRSLSSDPDEVGHIIPKTQQNLSPHLCYACHTTLTSRTSRASQSSGTHTIPLPEWTNSRLSSTPLDKGSESVMISKRMSEDEMKGSIGDFLLDE